MALTNPSPAAGILDASGLDKLKMAARGNSPEAVKAAAAQFEALFLENVMKTMRDAAPADGLLDSEQGRTMQAMLDQQYARAMASRGIGLADMLARQLTPFSASASPGKSANLANQADPTDPLAAFIAGASGAGAAPAVTGRHGGRRQVAAADGTEAASRPRSFAQRFAAMAEAASEATGIPAKFMIAQAALETGWGRREIHRADGSNSHNLFGIKAGKGWNGPVAEVMTTEYVNGVATRRVEKFRAYGSYEEAFADYAKMLTNSSRYKSVVASASDAVGFAQGLQRAGYATDPLYADKLRRVIARV